MLEVKGIETRIFGSGISLFLIVLYLEVRDLTKKTEALEKQLSSHISCFGISPEKKDKFTAEKPKPAKDNLSSHAAAAAILMSIGGG